MRLAPFGGGGTAPPGAAGLASGFRGAAAGCRVVSCPWTPGVAFFGVDPVTPAWSDAGLADFGAEPDGACDSPPLVRALDGEWWVGVDAPLLPDDPDEDDGE